jgi:fructose transport system ATP-binding protein
VTDSIPTRIPTLDATGLTKRYGRVVALDDVDFAVFPGEVLAVVGDNGTGKSTLIKCLAAVENPDSGIIRLEGEPTRFRRADDARIAGINAVHQSLRADAAIDLGTSLFRDHRVYPEGGFGWVAKQLERRGLRAPRALSTKVVLLDEPTASLGKRESTQVMSVIDMLRGRGLPIVVVLHDLPRAFDIADRVHVQVDGRRAAVVDPRRINVADALAIMRGDLQVPAADQALGPLR